MMAPTTSWVNGKLPPRRSFIDLTQTDDEDDDVEDADQAKALLARFIKPKVGQSRPLKRKSPLDEAEVRDPRETSAVDREPLFGRQAAQLPTNGASRAAENDISKVVNSSKSWSPLAEASGALVKRESRGSTPRSFAALPSKPRPSTSLQSAPRPSSSIPSQVDSSNVSSRSSLQPGPRPSVSLQTPTDSSSSTSSRSSSAKPSFMAKRKPTPRHTRSPSVMTAVPRTPRVVVPPPPTSQTISLSNRKINRLPSASPESEEESDPDEPKGIKPKYYPIEMYKLQAERGRYPQARTTNPDSIVLPTRPAPPHSIHRGHPKPAHSRKLYLRELLEKKLRKIQGPPVTMARDWDGSGSLASNFEFTATYKLQQGVARADEEFNYGCDCGFQCDPAGCTCLSKEEDSEELMVAYEHRNGKLLLKESFMNRKAMIYECSSLCPCLPSCWNRLVQHGRKIRLEIFHTGNRGFGLRSLDFVHKGQFIDTYLGEVISSAEAEIRENATTGSSGSHSSPSYLFSLDWFPASSDDESDDDEESSSSHYVVDGQRCGGPSRFMNHSCNPNCKMIPVSTHHGDQKIYDLAFFARRDIPPGVELTFDYNPGWSPEMNSADPNAVKCLCGEAQCRGQLWPNQRKSTNV